jgi:uncharacterized protein YbjT (DUF2867 family)
MELLKHGVRVRGTVRGPDSAKGLEAAFADEISTGALEIVFVPNIVASGSFDDALQSEPREAHLAA